jgi:hypothetical protein
MDVYERFEAVRRLNSGGSGYAFMRDNSLILLGWSVIALLLLLLLAVRRMRLEKERQAMERRFVAEADRLRLTAEEREIVEAVAARAGLKRKDSIFTLNESFDNGLAQLMQEVFAAGRNLVERKKLHGMIFSIKEKLGFIKSAGPDNRTGRQQSSRQIPLGTVVQISPAASRSSARIPAEVIQNDCYELLLRPELPLLCKPGDMWKVEYFKAAMTWEFEAITMACTEKGLALNHSERIRFLNRRRFTRVATRRPARIAAFSIFTETENSAKMGIDLVPAELTEIAGPGLRLKTTLKTSLNQRVLVQFELEPGCLIQDFALVRDVREGAGGRSIIVEMIGVDNKAVDELVRLTNRLATSSPQPENLEAYEAVEAGL